MSNKQPQNWHEFPRMDFNGVIMISSGDSDAEWTELLNPVAWILFRALSIWLSLMQTGGMQFLSLLRLAQPCCEPFAHILPPYRLSSRHYLKIPLFFCQVDGRFSTNLTDHHGH
jgi:hypothetical protein